MAAAGARPREEYSVKKYTKGAKWDLLVRFEDGSSYRLSAIPEKIHTNAAMVDSIEKNFLPVLESIKKTLTEAALAAHENPA